MRGTVAGLPSPYRIAEFLPSVYQEDDPFVQRFTAGLDEVWAPVLSTLDCLDAYVDPQLTPEDFLGWLSGWVGAVVDETTPLALRRDAVAHAAALHRSRGTPGGLRALIELLTGGYVEVADSGAASWSPTPDTVPPGEATPWVAVRVTLEQASEQTLASVRAAVETAVASAKPAHVVHSVEVVSR
jgi:phage tail-like protein